MSRIIAGSAKGRTLEAPKGKVTRPTTDRVREAVFTMLSSWLGTVDESPAEHLGGIAFLDLYSGSGAIALEAASRGATPVVGIEKDQSAARLIQHNAQTLGLEVTVRATSAVHYAAETGGQFDVVYIDPPYEVADEALDELLEALASNERLAPRAMIVVERSKRSAEPNWPDSVEEHWDRRYGETTLFIGVTRDQEN